jgi:8-oxo-dGTP pyrophosphatase MutT (NUDIX family)
MPDITDSPFYRVSVKALIFDDQNRLLVFQDSAGEFEMPGGGWEHDETLAECIARELYEEMRVKPQHIGDVRFVYTGPHDNGYHKCVIVVPVTLIAHDFQPTDDDLVAAKFITKEEFSELPFQFNEKAVKAYADKIWP